jgi:hypothetical protein
MGWTETVGDFLKQCTGPGATTAGAEDHFDEVAATSPSHVLGGALADMFRSKETPPFGQLASQMFGNASAEQKASVLTELLRNAGPSLQAMLSGAGLGALANGVARGEAITPEAASQVPPEVVNQMAEHAEKHDPSIVDRLGSLYSQHPALIKTLGSAALAVTLAKLSNRQQT